MTAPPDASITNNEKDLNENNLLEREQAHGKVDPRKKSDSGPSIKLPVWKNVPHLEKFYTKIYGRYFLKHNICYIVTLV